MSRLDKVFFRRDAVTVARDLLGKSLVRRYHGELMSGVIVEAEAYVGEEDTACHASRGCTPRTRVMYGPPGHYYIYLIYGMYHMLNIVTGDEGHPQAVLIRALRPGSGVDRMRELRGGVVEKHLCDGPGKLCQALAIDRSLNELPVEGDELWVENAPPVDEEYVLAGPRVGIGYASDQDQQRPWRFSLDSRAQP
ncbi:DNA-3-methyladenine glycosylase [Thiolapillus brandeum]|uniref:Putative 3-methyladenine DNA glycosylase n=1 Tax=Thiolapillus brandeum TaxID=1076588 RepID=A0A7U6JHM0_9GAMM|nr:DNA-3-methyladenine glycosylase [Thiolapillus brandeum]BAO43345.1 DNA-3-methyladenine glycosylase [Thiolapillus brandeum]